MKRVRTEDLFSTQPARGHSGSYLRLALTSGTAFRSKGWPWVQMCMRGILGGMERVEKANMLADGSMIVKTQNHKQTEKLMKAKKFGDEDCEVVSDPKLNSSRGTITAYDLLELTESEVVGWLRDFGVTGARRFTRRANGKTENTATILLTFDTPSCPSKLELDYITYHVNQYIPNPLMCYGCGRFGRPQLKCPSDPLCLRCGMGKHDGECDAKCINCKKDGHSCLSRDCEQGCARLMNQRQHDSSYRPLAMDSSPQLPSGTNYTTSTIVPRSNRTHYRQNRTTAYQRHSRSWQAASRAMSSPLWRC